MGIAHVLKCWPVSFQAMLEGKKTHEVRRADRAFCVGDILHQREYDPTEGAYTGRDLAQTITFITPPGSFGLPDDVVVMSVTLVR